MHVAPQLRGPCAIVSQVQLVLLSQVGLRHIPSAEQNPVAHCELAVQALLQALGPDVGVGVLVGIGVLVGGLGVLLGCPGGVVGVSDGVGVRVGIRVALGVGAEVLVARGAGGGVAEGGGACAHAGSLAAFTCTSNRLLAPQSLY